MLFCFSVFCVFCAFFACTTYYKIKQPQKFRYIANCPSLPGWKSHCPAGQQWKAAESGMYLPSPLQSGTSTSSPTPSQKLMTAAQTHLKTPQQSGQTHVCGTDLSTFRPSGTRLSPQPNPLLGQPGSGRMEQKCQYTWRPTPETFQISTVPSKHHPVACHHCGAVLVAQVLLAHLQMSRHDE